MEALPSGMGRACTDRIVHLEKPLRDVFAGVQVARFVAGRSCSLLSLQARLLLASQQQHHLPQAVSNMIQDVATRRSFAAKDGVRSHRCLLGRVLPPACSRKMPAHAMDGCAACSWHR